MKNQNLQEFILSDGVVIKQSRKSTAACNFHCVSVFTQNLNFNTDNIFIPCCRIDKELVDTLKCYIHINKCKIHVWRNNNIMYSDPREAAYVSAIFKENPIEIDNYVHKFGKWTKFPKDLYDVPLTFDDDLKSIFVEPKHLKSYIRLKQKIFKPKSKQTKNQIIDDNTKIDKIWSKICKMYDIPSLLDKYDRDDIVEARKTLTLSEFRLRFEL